MADPLRIIVHSGEHGLGEAADYYRSFPWEPSPAGDMDLAKAVIVEVKNANLDVVLFEMAKTKPGGIVLLVCHAWNEGLLMPVAAGSKLTSGKRPSRA